MHTCASSHCGGGCGCGDRPTGSIEQGRVGQGVLEGDLHGGGGEGSLGVARGEEGILEGHLLGREGAITGRGVEGCRQCAGRLSLCAARQGKGGVSAAWCSRVGAAVGGWVCAGCGGGTGALLIRFEIRRDCDVDGVIRDVSHSQSHALRQKGVAVAEVKGGGGLGQAGGWGWTRHFLLLCAEDGRRTLMRPGRTPRGLG
jgi:hypothetical protein